MEFFKKETQIDFMGIRRYTGIVSVLLFVLSVGALVIRGLNFGLDFTGGPQIEVRFLQEVSPQKIKEILERKGFHSVRAQQYGSVQDILIRIGDVQVESDVELESHGANLEKISLKSKPKEVNSKLLSLDNHISDPEQKISARVKQALLTDYPDMAVRRSEFVGSEVGAELIEQGGIAVLVSILATMIYIALRFEYRLAVSAAVGLLYDAVLILGVFSLFGFEFDLATLASVLAVLGYSLNDTIVVFDRIRENFRKVRKNTPGEIVNLSINQTLSRTIMTSFMTLLVVLALLFFGGETLFGFSMAFFIGILMGTFSSIYVSGALALWLGLSRADLLPKPKPE